MPRREFIAGLGGAAAWPLAGHAQQAARTALIARLHPGSARDDAIGVGLRAFRDGLRALGQIEGQTYRLEERYSEGVPARLPMLADELVALKPDVIVAVADDAVRAAKAAAANIPIVMAIATRDPVAAGYVAGGVPHAFYRFLAFMCAFAEVVFPC